MGVKQHYPQFFNNMHHFKRSNLNCLSVIVQRLNYELVIPRMWGLFVWGFVYLFVCFPVYVWPTWLRMLLSIWLG